MSYGKVHDVFWDGEKIMPLSDRAALLALYLITGPHRNAIGCFKLGIGAITDQERFGAWGIEGVSKALLEMAETGFIVRDDKTGWTLITNALALDPIKGAKPAIHAAKLAFAVPANSIVYPRLKEKLEPLLQAETKALSDSVGWPMREPTEGVSKGHTIPKRSPSPLPLPEPDPDPEPKRIPQVAPNGALPSPPSDDGLDLPVPFDRSVEGEAVRCWNAMAGRVGLAEVKLLTDTRRKKLRARLAECGGIEGWQAALAKIEAARWMHGENDRGWSANFKWILQQESFATLMEGGYDRAAHPRARPAQPTVSDVVDRIVAEHAEEVP